MSASPSDMPSQLEAPHPEFGYLAPTKRYRRKITLTLKAAVLGGLSGAAAMYFLTIDREDKPLTMLATPVLIAPATSAPTPVAQAPAPAPAAATPALAVAKPAPPARTPAKPPRTAATDIAGRPVPFVPETIALPTVAPRDLELRGSVSPTLPAPAAAPVPQAPPTVEASPSPMAAEPEPAPAPVAKAKPKKKIVREPQPERSARFGPPEPEPPPRRFGLPIFGFGW